jgi:hypothetical protein
VGRNSEGLEDYFVIDRIKPGDYSLTFFGDNVYKEVKNVKAPSNGLEIELLYSPPPKIEALVIDSKTGDPIKRYKVRVRKIQAFRKRQSSQLNRWYDFDDENGLSEIDVVGSGIYKIQVAAEGYAPKWSESINTDESPHAIIELEPGGVIHGKVLDEQGNAVTGAKIIPLSKASGNQPASENIFTSEEGACESINGEFILRDLPSGSETLKVTHPKYAFTIVRDIQVIKGYTTEDIEIVLSKGATIEGYVYNVDGEPEAGVLLSLDRRIGYDSIEAQFAGQLGAVITDSNGFYRISGLPEMSLYVTRKNSSKNLGVIRRHAILKNNTVTRLDFGGIQLLTGTVEINGLPLVQKRLLLTDAGTPHFGPFVCYAQTDAQGQFVFRGVVPATHGIYYQIDETGMDWIKIMDVNIGEEDLNLGIITDDATDG